VSVVIDLDSRRSLPTALRSLSHPAGVTLPFEGSSDADLILPEIRGAILSGDYSGDLLKVLPGAVRSGDRVLVIGAGLGTASTLVAKTRGIKRIIAIEPNTELCPYLQRCHELNEVGWVESINALLGHGVRGRTPFFARHDIRTSSALPDDCSWQMAMVVPCMEMNLILTEERISLIVFEIPSGGAALLAKAELRGVDRILVSCGDDVFGKAENDEVREVLAGRGYAMEEAGNALMFGRTKTRGAGFQGGKRAGAKAG